MQLFALAQGGDVDTRSSLARLLSLRNKYGTINMRYFVGGQNSRAYFIIYFFSFFPLLLYLLPNAVDFPFQERSLEIPALSRKEIPSLIFNILHIVLTVRQKPLTLQGLSHNFKWNTCVALIISPFRSSSLAL